MKKGIFSAVMILLFGVFFYYCGSTAVVEEPADDISSLDIILNKDVVSDATSDVISPDVSPNDVPLDILVEDGAVDTTIEDVIVSDIMLSDEEQKDVIEDVETDAMKDGGGDGGGKDTSFSDNEFTDTSSGEYSIAGKVTINGGKPESDKQVFVMVFDKIIGENVAPVAFTTTDSNGDYFIDGLAAGKYYVFAIYDIDGSGDPDPSAGDPYGYYLNNPIEIKNSSLTGINIDIYTIQLMASSVYMQRQRSRNAYLINLVAKVLDPKDGEPLTDATVTAIDPVSPQIHTLTYNPQTEQYEKTFNPYAQNAVIAREGNYQFTIQHPSYGSQPVKLTLLHKPMNDLVTITEPANNSAVKVGEDLRVAWKNPAGADTNFMIQLMRRVGNQIQEVMRDENQPIQNPYTIDGEYIDKTGMYIINVVSGRFSMVQNGVSVEATSGMVIITAQ